MQLVLHAPFGSRITKAWGLALRKRFCRQFNFELQAAATEDGLMLSLGPQHSFPLSDVFRYLHPETTRDVLVQAFLDAPVFETRWRWNATLSLAVPRSRSGRRLAPQVQRMLAADLLASAFPDAAACLENIPGDREIPDHPLVNQTVRDCLEEAMDLAGLNVVLHRIHSGELRLVARDTPEPSAFAHEILDAKPYAFLDDAPLEERRSRAVQTRRGTDAPSSDDLGALDAAAIDRVRDEARPDPRDADELHDTLMIAGFLREAELDQETSDFLRTLAGDRRACRARLLAADGSCADIIVAAERLPEILCIHPGAELNPSIEPPPSRARAWERAAAVTELIRGRLCLTGPTTAIDLSRSLAIGIGEADAALLALEAEGVVLRGRFTPASPAPTDASGDRAIEWCDRALLARIHRYTLHRLRAEIEPVSPADFMRFLFKWQHVDPADRLTGIDGLREVIAMLDGYELAGAAWERAVLAARIDGYQPSMLDMLCLTGEVGWARFSPIPPERTEPPRLSPATPIALFLREHRDAWQTLRAGQDAERQLPASALQALAALGSRGASFFNDLRAASGLDADDLRSALGSLAASGLAASDGFAGLRALLRRSAGRSERASFAGRWTTIGDRDPACSRDAAVEAQAWAFLRRYGIVFRRLLARETLAAPWRDLARVYRRLEARGEIRGGRFVSGMSGEQFAMPRAVERLREVRRTPGDDRLVTIGTADPLNLTGILTTGERIRATVRQRVSYRNGVPQEWQSPGTRLTASSRAAVI